MRLLCAVLRMAAAIAGATAIIVTLEASVGHGEFQFFNFFGYFTIQGNAIFAVVMLITAIAGFTHRRQSSWFVFARASATTYMIIVGIVYNTLLSQANVGALVPWANYVLHLWLPIYAAVDWIFFGDRPVVPWRRLPLSLVYPLIWTGATLLRQVIEPNPFVPYPFLNLDTLGWGVLLYVIGIAAGFIGFGALVWWTSHIRPLKP